jgi:hypothetical protein
MEIRKKYMYILKEVRDQPFLWVGISDSSCISYGLIFSLQSKRKKIQTTLNKPRENEPVDILALYQSEDVKYFLV